MMNKLKYMEINGNISLFLCISICYILLKLNDIKIYRTIKQGYEAVRKKKSRQGRDIGRNRLYLRQGVP